MQTAETLFARYSREIYSYLCRLTGNYAAAEDLLSEVFMKTMEQLRRGADDGFNWRPWLYKVAGNYAASYHRRQKFRRFVSLDGLVLHDESPSQGAAAEEKEMGEKIQDAMSKLSMKLKAALVMSVYQELSYEEIAQSLQINIGTVKSRINEAKKRLKAILEESYA